MRRRGGGQQHDDDEMPMFGNATNKMNGRSRRRRGSKGSNNLMLLLVIIVAAVGGALVWFRTSTTTTSSYDNNNIDNDNSISDDERIKRFMIWFEKMGGKLKSNNIWLSKFDEYGYGLVMKKKNPKNNNNDQKELLKINKNDVLFTVPNKMIFSAKNTINTWKSTLQLNDEFINDFIKSIISKYFKPYEQQDAIISLQLMIECSFGTKSKFYPYLSLLPLKIPPRLDSLNNDELVLLQDDVLENMGKQYYKELQYNWKELQDHEIINELINALTKHHTTNNANNPLLKTNQCFTFTSFHKYMAIVSSHAMLLDNIKYLVPLADMINHESRPNQEDGQEDNETFTTFHQLRKTTTNGNDNNEDEEDDHIFIKVLADRDVELQLDDDNEQQEQQIQIFEEYGKLDNSLYLLAHGFIPVNNPHHCALISSDYLPSQITNENLKFALKLLLSLDDTTSQYQLDSICVRSNGHIVDDTSESHNRITSYLAISNLEQQQQQQTEENSGTHQNEQQQQQQQRQYCIDAVIDYNTNNNNNSEQKQQQDNNNNDNKSLLLLDTIRSKCTNYNGKDNAIQQMISKSAKQALDNMKTSLEDDLLLEDEYKQLLQKGQNYISVSGSSEESSTKESTNTKEEEEEESNDHHKKTKINLQHAILAIQFRIADKKILHTVAKSIDSKQARIT